MKRGKLRELSRELLGDTKLPYLWSDIELNAHINEAEAEACRRARLLVDSSTAAICTITVTIDTAEFALDPRVVMVRRAKLASQTTPLVKKTMASLDEEAPGWQDDVASTPGYCYFDAGSTNIGIYPKADTADTMKLTVVRVPLAEMNDDEDIPEIPERYHYSLLHWVLHRAYLKRDAETRDDKASLEALALFEAEFGKRRSAEVERFEMEHEGYDMDNGAY